MNAISRLKNEVNGKNRSDLVRSYEEIIVDNLNDSTKEISFFSLPLNNILRIISKTELTEQEEPISFMKTIITETIKAHSKEKETVLLLPSLNTKDIDLNLESCIDILSLFTQCDIFIKLKTHFKDFWQTVDFDFDYVIQQKEKEIQQLKQKLALKSRSLYESTQNKHDEDFESVHVHVKMKETHSPDKKQTPRRESHDLQPQAAEKKQQKITKSTTMTKPQREKQEEMEKDIFIAAKDGKLSSVQYLIEKEGIDINKKAEKDYGDNVIYSGNSALHIASRTGQLPIVQYLIEKGANIDIRNNIGSTPLHIACQKGQLPVVEYLIEKNANIEAKEKDGETPLHYACRNSPLKIVKTLIEKGANIEAINMDKKTPLHIASSWGAVDIVRYLLSKGANRKARNKSGNTPYDCAGQDAIRKLLK